MKSLLAKTLTSTALVLVTVTVAHAVSDSPFPTAAKEFADPLPATIQYFDQRTSRGPANSGTQNSPLPSAAQEFSSVPLSPALMRYFEQREAAIATGQKERPSRRSDYVPKSNNPRLN